MKELTEYWVALFLSSSKARNKNILILGIMETKKSQHTAWRSRIILAGSLDDLAVLVDKSQTEGYVIEKSLLVF